MLRKLLKIYQDFKNKDYKNNYANKLSQMTNEELYKETRYNKMMAILSQYKSNSLAQWKFDVCRDEWITNRKDRNSYNKACKDEDNWRYRREGSFDYKNII